jgi:predicted transcriptional regulator
MSSGVTEPRPVLPKVIVREALDRMPENATLHEIAEEIAILAALEEAEDDIRAGRVSSNDEVKERARRWRSK